MNGTNTIPRTYRGEGLAYISPEEAIWLRQMGGGIPQDRTGQLDPTRQITGPAGIPRFPGPSAAYGGGAATAAGGVSPGSTGPGQGGGHGGPSHGGGGFPGYPQGYRSGPVVGPAVVKKEEEEEPNVPTPEEIAERAAKLDERIRAGADRQEAMYRRLGYGPSGPQYGQTSDGTQLFPGSTPTPISQIPAWAGLLGTSQRPTPARESVQVGLQQTPTGDTPLSLLERVSNIAAQLRPPPAPEQTAAHGGLVGRYDLGGLVDSMMLQASRSTANIPTNMVR